MKVDLVTAVRAYEEAPLACRVATLSPAYAFADANRDPSLEPVFLLYREPGFFWLLSALKGKVLELPFHDLQSPYGYGGPISNTEDPFFIKRAWESYLQWCRTNRVIVDFVRLHPLLQGKQPYLGSRKFDRETVGVNLGVPDVVQSYSRRCRRSIRKAVKGGIDIVRYSMSSDLASRFGAFHRKGMRSIEATGFYFFPDEYFHAIAVNTPCQVFVAQTSDGRWQSAALVLLGSNVAEFHLGASTEFGRSIAASSLVHHAAALYAQARGKLVYFLGGGTDSRPDNSLLQFKKQFASIQLQFEWGYHVHDAKTYRVIAADYEQRGLSTSEVLFYRRPRSA